VYIWFKVRKREFRDTVSSRDSLWWYFHCLCLGFEGYCFVLGLKLELLMIFVSVLILCLEDNTAQSMWQLTGCIIQDSLSLSVRLTCPSIRLRSFWSHPSFSACRWPETDKTSYSRPNIVDFVIYSCLLYIDRVHLTYVCMYVEVLREINSNSSLGNDNIIAARRQRQLHSN